MTWLGSATGYEPAGCTADTGVGACGHCTGECALVEGYTARGARCNRCVGW